MKIRNGINPDYADHDEIDHDALDAIQEYTNQQITFEELANQIGPDAAHAMQARFEGTPYLHWLDDVEGIEDSEDHNL